MNEEPQMYARLYDILLEPFLKNMKRKVAQIVARFELNPVMDICCGPGAQVNFLKVAGLNAFGTDLDWSMIRYASTKYRNSSFFVADARELPLKDNSIGAVLLSFALHENPERERKNIIREAMRTLKPDGIIFIVDFNNPWDLKSRAGAFVRNLIERLPGKDHYQNGREFLKTGGLSAFLNRVGLVEIERYHFPLAASALVAARRKN